MGAYWNQGVGGHLVSSLIGNQANISQFIQRACDKAATEAGKLLGEGRGAYLRGALVWYFCQRGGHLLQRGCLIRGNTALKFFHPNEG